jgi:hypothetical protein
MYISNYLLIYLEINKRGHDSGGDAFTGCSFVLICNWHNFLSLLYIHMQICEDVHIYRTNLLARLSLATRINLWEKIPYR